MDVPKQRPRSKSTFSFKSDKSDKSVKAPKLPKEKLTESAAEKHQNHLSTTTKANPNAAMEEAQPSTTPFCSVPWRFSRTVPRKETVPLTPSQLPLLSRSPP